MVLGLIFFPIILSAMSLLGVFTWLSYRTSIPSNGRPKFRLRFNRLSDHALPMLCLHYVALSHSFGPPDAYRHDFCCLHACWTWLLGIQSGMRASGDGCRLGSAP